MRTSTFPTHSGSFRPPNANFKDDNMPLPYLKDAIRCTAKCKARQARCNNLAAYGMRVCHKHGARQAATITYGQDHSQYKHGNATKQARTEHSQKMAEIRDLEALGFKIGMFTGSRIVGRKPKPLS